MVNERGIWGRNALSQGILYCNYTRLRIDGPEYAPSANVKVRFRGNDIANSSKHRELQGKFPILWCYGKGGGRVPKPEDREDQEGFGSI